MILFIIFLVFTTVRTQFPNCPPPPEDCRLPCPFGTCCTCENPCPATCDNPKTKPRSINQCNFGCYTICPKGQVFNKIGGFCVPLEDCNLCGSGEVLVEITCGGPVCGVRYCDGSIGICEELCFLPGEGPIVCHCKEGLLRDRETGLCVNPDSPSCKRQQCRDGEQYYSCSTESCSLNCYNYGMICPNQTICKKPGNCDCISGLVRDTNTGKCVKPDDCTYNCTTDEHFAKYVWPCEQTCDNYPGSFICPGSYFFPGSCLCNEGLIRDTITGKCVKPDDPSCLFQSSPDCTIPGEHYYICNTTDCERTCQKPVVDCPNEAIGICNQPGNCDCKPQLVRDLTTGQCVYMDSPSCIAQRCRQDQKYYQCSTKNCFPTCDNPTPLCTNICIEPGNCDCKPGLLRTESGDCIKPESCPTPECDDNEQYYNCSTANCQRTCKEPNPICTEECITPGNCDCKIGLVRDTKNGQCCHPNKKSCKKQRIKP